MEWNIIYFHNSCKDTESNLGQYFVHVKSEQLCNIALKIIYLFFSSRNSHKLMHLRTYLYVLTKGEIITYHK